MKQLKITINGEVKTFDLPENGEYKCEVTESYFPKAGDCVIMENKEYNVLYWCKLTDVTTVKANFNIAVNSRLEISTKGCLNINKDRIYTKINPEELYVKYLEAGYYWDYQTDTIKPIKWVPKYGDDVWFLNIYIEPERFVFDKDNYEDKRLLEKGLLFPTKEECQKFADYCCSYFDKIK